MKNISIYTLFLAIVVSVISAASASAQTGRIAKASIPFEFQVGSVKLPAGEYIFERLASTSDTVPLLIRDKDHNSVASTHLSFEHLTGRKLPDRPTLIFADLGTTVVLAYLSDPEINYIGRVGKLNWRGKKVWKRAGTVDAIWLKPIVARN